MNKGQCWLVTLVLEIIGFIVFWIFAFFFMTFYVSAFRLLMESGSYEIL